MRFRIPPSGWTGALILLLSGCAQLGSSSQHELPEDRPSSARSASNLGKATARTPAVETHQARKPPRPGPAVDSKVEPLSAETGRSTINGKRNIAHASPVGQADSPNSRTQAAAAVVDQELAELPLAERQRVISDLDGLSPANTRAVLRAWKQSRNRQSAAPAPAITTGEANAVKLAGATEESTTTRLRKSLSAGLGTVTAWGTAIVTGRRPEPGERAVSRKPSATADDITVQRPADETTVSLPSAERTDAGSRDSEQGRAEAGGSTQIEAEEGASLRSLIAEAEAEITELEPGRTEADREEYISKHVSLRMLYLVSGRHELAMQAIPEVDLVDQEFWQHLFWGLANYFDTSSIPAADERAAEAAAQLSQAVLRLQRRARLELRHVTFCDRIDGFGNYDRCRSDEFRPGQEVLLYVELENIASVLDDSGQYRTSHTSVIEITAHASDDDPIDRVELPETLDLCRRPRHDYFHSYSLTIPGEITSGDYVLKLSVTDTASRRQASYAVNFRVNGPPVAVPAEAVELDAPPGGENETALENEPLNQDRLNDRDRPSILAGEFDGARGDIQAGSDDDPESEPPPLPPVQ